MTRWARWSRRLLFGLLGIVALYAVARVWVGAVASSRLEAEIARIRATGEHLTLAQAFPSVPEGENAAPLLEAAWAKIEPEGEELFASTFLEDPVTAPEASLVAAAAWVDRNGPAFELLSHALAARPRCRFGPPGHVEDLVFQEIPGLQMLGRLLATRANVASRRGDPDAALADAQALVLLGDRIAQTPLLVHRLVGNGVQQVGDRAAENAFRLGPPSEAACRALDRVLASLGPIRVDRDVILAERAYGSALFDHAGEDRRARDTMGGGEAEGLPWLCALAPGPALSLDHARSLRLWTRALPLGAGPWSEVGPAWTGLEREARRETPWYARYSNSGVWAAAASCRRLAECEARRHLTRLALRLEMHEASAGGLPARLADLKDALQGGDPLSGAPYVYRTTDGGKGYLLYSFGRNGKDDGGIEEEIPGASHADDIAFRRPAR